MKTRYLFLTIFLIAANLQAQETAAPLRLTPDEAVELAIRNNLGLESSRLDVASRKRASNLSWNQFIPNVTVAGTANRDNQAREMPFTSAIPGTGTQVPGGVMNPDILMGNAALPQWQAIANVQASLSLNLAMFENIRRLRLDYERGLISHERVRAGLERDVRKAYHNMLLLQENVNLWHGNFENAERSVQMAQANFNAGLVPQLAVLQAQVARENLRPVIDQVESGLRLSMAQFSFFLGLPYDTVFELVPLSEEINFVSLDVAEMISQAARGKPDILELRHTILMMESARRAQSLSLTPSLTLSWNNQSVLMDPWNSPWFGSDSSWQHSGSLSITMGLRLHSLLPFSTDSQAVRHIDDQIQTASIGLAQMVRGTEIEIYNTVLTLERIRLSMEVQQQTVNLAEQSFRLTEQAYQAGQQDFLQVQNAQQALLQAQVQLLEQQFNYLNGLIDLEYSIGVPFGTLSRN